MMPQPSEYTRLSLQIQRDIEKLAQLYLANDGLLREKNGSHIDHR